MAMEKHALGILEAANSWSWPPTSRIQQSGTTSTRSKFKAVTPKLLAGFISESIKQGGTLLDRFWFVVEECHPKLKENVQKLRLTDFSSSNQSELKLFEGLDRDTLNFDPIFQLAAELFTHLGVAFMNPGGEKLGGATPYSVSEFVNLETDELMKLIKEEGVGTRKQIALKALLIQRDGNSCLLTGMAFDSMGIVPILAHVIPNSVHDKPDTLKCIAMFAGNRVRDLVIRYLNDTGNVMNIQSDAHTSYDNLKWGIEAHSDGNGKVKYIFRTIPPDPNRSPGFIRLREGDEITFGQGPKGEHLGPGPLPLLCNLQLAVARVLHMSGAAEIIAQLQDDADDTAFPRVYLVSEDFCHILDAKLLISGRALVV